MYEKHFSLRELPFNLTPDPRFLYSHPSCQEAFATLCYGVENRKGIVLITGAAGTGKTTLIKLFMEKAAQRVRAACILDPHLTFIELLQCALDAFGVAQFSGDRVSLMQQFRDYLLEQRSHDHRVALLLDESQDIQDEVLEELRLVSDLEHAGDKLVQLVLAGQSEFELRLEQPRFDQLRQRVILRSRLEPLGEEDIGPYIDFRLRTAGYSERSLFQHAAIHRIGYFSQGIPRLINVICDHALLIACATSSERIGAETIDEIADDLHLDGSDSEFRNTPLAQAPDAMPRIDAGAEEARRADTFEGKLSHAPLHISAAATSSSHPDLRVDLGSLWLLAKRLQKKSWIELSAVVASVALVICGGMYLARPGSDTVSPKTDSINLIQEGLAPISRELYRVLGRDASWETPVKQTKRSYTNIERRDANARLGEAKTGTDRGKPENSGRPVDTSPRRDRAPMTETTRVPLERRNPQTPRRGPSSSAFAVVGNSYVREKPASKAEVIATLRPGTRIQVVGRSGEYFRVRSLDNEAIRGYVHKEDAFFEPYH
jgi:general secretion pathway protein A